MNDAPSLAAVGGWPWSRYTMARLTEAIAGRGAMAIGYDFLFPEADRLTPKGDEGPLGFDPVTNSQDPSVLHLSIDVESADAANTIVAASFDGESDPKRNLVRYIFVREDGAWRLDDMRGEEGDDKWDLREVMSPKAK